MHARIDVLTRPRFWSLLPSTILDWVVIIVSVSPSIDAPKCANTSCECYLEYFTRRLHRTDLLSVGARVHYSGWTSLHLRKHIATGATHHPPTWHTSHKYQPSSGQYSSLLMKASCLRLKLVELNFFASFTTDDQSIFNVSNTSKSSR